MYWNKALLKKIRLGYSIPQHRTAQTYQLIIYANYLFIITSQLFDEPLMKCWQTGSSAKERQSEGMKATQYAALSLTLVLF